MTDRKLIEDFLVSVKEHDGILDYKVCDDGSVEVVLHPAIKNIKLPRQGVVSDCRDG